MCGDVWVVDRGDHLSHLIIINQETIIIFFYYNLFNLTDKITALF